MARGAEAARERAAARVVALPGYEVIVAPGALDDAGAIITRAAPAHHYAVVSDPNVAPLYVERVRASLAGAAPGATMSLLLVPPGEEHKTRELWAHLTDELLASGAGRDTTIVALGGGVVGDLAGFVAATYMRGIPVVQLPTTLLAMVDASVGGKTGVDTPAGKNLVGAFHPPAAVIADPDTLASLPAPELRSGSAEMIKHGVVADARYFDQVAAILPSLAADDTGIPSELTALIARSVEIKAAVVADDERERGRRKILNFGHTLGHAIETVSGYRLLHGEAVAIGMALESEIAERIGVAEAGTAMRVRAALTAGGLPVVVPLGIDPAEILAATRSDKKARGGRVEYALPAAVGRMAGAERGWGLPVEDVVVLGVLD
ncbi:MAG TPA: 3-dehydroquinate synthase [Gemmatimonadaceae bacterium]|nr:3-dehydroquinate synthase [Gemmatimonadaceae bacterium]